MEEMKNQRDEEDETMAPEEDQKEDCWYVNPPIERRMSPVRKRHQKYRRR